MGCRFLLLVAALVTALTTALVTLALVLRGALDVETFLASCHDSLLVGFVQRKRLTPDPSA